MEKRALQERMETRGVTKFIGVSVDLGLHQELRIVAAQEGISASQLYRRAIVEYLGKVKR